MPKGPNCLRRRRPDRRRVLRWRPELPYDAETPSSNVAGLCYRRRCDTADGEAQIRAALGTRDAYPWTVDVERRASSGPCQLRTASATRCPSPSTLDEFTQGGLHPRHDDAEVVLQRRDSSARRGSTRPVTISMNEPLRERGPRALPGELGAGRTRRPGDAAVLDARPWCATRPTSGRSTAASSSRSAWCWHLLPQAHAVHPRGGPRDDPPQGAAHLKSLIACLAPALVADAGPHRGPNPAGHDSLPGRTSTRTAHVRRRVRDRWPNFDRWP